MQRVRAAELELGHPALAHARVAAGAGSVGQRRAEVETRCRRPRSGAGRRRASSSISACASSAYSPALKRGVDREERDQAMLELRALGRRGRAGERSRDRRRPGGRRRRRPPGPRPARARQPGERDRDRGLAHAGRAEQRDDLGACHARGIVMPRPEPLSRAVSLVSGRVLLTGATGGIGHAIARAFAGRGRAS